jgi:membrane fusion protein (multidrug efflux system)
VKSAEAALSTAKLILESNKNLYEQDVVSEFDLMTAQNDLTEAEARLALCKAEEVNASNNLSYTEVRSPVNGVASMIPYRVGALVNSSIAQPLVTVSDDSRVYAYFSMAENQMLDMVQQYGSLNNAIKQMPEVELIMSNGEKYEHTGKINAISGTISESTGAVSIRAVFNNRNHLLRNGGSGTIIIPMTLQNCMVIPQSATYELQDRVFVYKVVDGKAYTMGGNLAGSTSMLIDCVRCAIRFGIKEEDAVKMATEVPAKMMGLDSKGKIEVGMDADFIIVDEDFNLIRAIARGEF